MAIGAALALLALPWGVNAGVQEGVEAWRSGDYARAVSEWQPLAETGDPDAQFNLGQAYKLGRGVPQDMERARDLFGQAADQGHLRAEANYGLILFQDGNREDAMPYIIRAANRGEPRAQYIYGTALFNGDLAPRDWVRAYALMSNASAAGLPQAAASLQQMDRYIPLEQREAGTAMAAQMAEANPVTQVAVAPPPPPTPAPAPSPTFTPVPVPAPAASPPAATPPPASPPAAAPAQQPPVVATQSPSAQPSSAAPAARSGDWRIQLGSFRERPRAENLWRQVSGRASSLANLQPYLVRAGPYTRLQAGPFRTRAEAQQACAAATRAGSECITVRRR
ncbi:SPOR domain-containing protein [Parasphingopyxis algicola]|uniref:SPOR domain-containing protein n=1 Tax=Parasphingopyxis algicola TaxID=2026624 RepID=UPI001FE5E515|nr:SPOR domain-containing protein [Parasphingopyxis algicola]